MKHEEIKFKQSEKHVNVAHERSMKTTTTASKTDGRLQKHTHMTSTIAVAAHSQTAPADGPGRDSPNKFAQWKKDALGQRIIE